MAVQNPNNWHWVDKNCIEWAKKYLTSKLVGQSTDGDKTSKFAEISKVSSIEGDCEVNQRKGKVISLFELQITMLISGKVDDQEFDGSISVPDISFDSEITDYQFEISIYKETTKLNEIKPIIRETLLPKLRDIFQQFGKDLLKENGNDIQVSEDKVTSQYTKSNQQASFRSVEENVATTASTTSASKTTNPATAASTATTSSGSTTNKSSSTKFALGTGNTTSIHIEPVFNVPASELYMTFIEKNRVMAWSKSPIKISNTKDTVLKLNEEFKLFGGNVTSKLVSQIENKELVFEWRLNSWNDKIISKLKLEFHESKAYHETKLQVTWDGIPIGEEERVRNNFEEFYVRAIKITFGFGAVL
ncbi:hypothetical protein TPHA_0C02170 [Tetrapisispora phaffii CBS 4417]|uniref:Activator of Hsp90 ATPase AHSA1-like N-terminal domain-containing protein n=1 Tax=Tetrapisispora phaffii (strain ATCC 24235 / CBS 4417 / NBRC 1672 / NRRL Y-8282 / UCD 70-5) TaxID=1071381 RepID=G8BRJ5_TETPH|nr:hypothetical protein TPHA_0C02170 [Tetrapisispora phaffii CBS 4417]CCE62371.1 hypothetical protein TPHA_0C02170 [Tetrapisispora phaffii CBS 4417]